MKVNFNDVDVFLNQIEERPSSLEASLTGGCTKPLQLHYTKTLTLTYTGQPNTNGSIKKCLLTFLIVYRFPNDFYLPILSRAHIEL